MPVVRLQANLLVDGVLLGLSFNHHIADATGAGIILKLLPESCCASSAQDVSILPNRKVESELRGQLSSIVVSLNHVSGEWQLEDESRNDAFTANGSKPIRFPGPGLINGSFVVSNEKVMHLRGLCNSLIPILLRRHRDSEIKTVPESSRRHDPPSLNNILVAVLGLCVERARAKNGLILPSSTGIPWP